MTGYTQQDWRNNDPTTPVSAAREAHQEEQYADAMADTAALYGKDVRAWAPATNYTAGQFVISPFGALVSAIATHLSGASFTPANWTNTIVPAWLPNTVYAAGQQVISPSGDVVSAKIAFTSGASYSSANWNLSPTYVQKGAWFNVKDYGAKGDGVADDTAAIQACIAATRVSTAVGVSGAMILFPPGEYLISAHINLYRFSGILMGAGLGNPPTYSPNRGNGTVLRWIGPNTDSMIYVRDYRYVKIANLRLEGNDTTKPTYGIQSDWLTGDSVGTNANLIVENVQIGKTPWSTQGTLKGAMQAGIGFTGNNGNNDQFAIRDVTIDTCDVGIDLPNAQSIWGQVENTTIGNSVTAGIRTSAALSGYNLSFNNNAVDILVNSSANVTVFGWWSEQSSMQVHVAAQGRCSVFGGRWRLQAPMVGGANFAQHDLATTGGGLFFHDLEIINTLTPHPQVKVVATGGGNANGGFLVMRDCATTMAITDFNVSSVGANALTIDIASGNLNIKRKFTSTSTLSAEGASLGAAAGNMGFYGGVPVAKPTVSGSRGSNAALASLITALASQGLLTDTTTT